MMKTAVMLAVFLAHPLQSLLDDPGQYYCPPTQRYDLTEFPPRCIDCQSIVSNEMTLSQIPTQLRIKRSVQKFSPGLPQNQTCGCWRAAVNQSAITVALNDSWVVSGLLFSSSRTRWFREISIQASGDNETFIDWGNYSFQNYTDSSMAIFRYPIRARFFRLLVLRYVNQYIGVATGFPLKVQALVSNTQPFSCRCPMLSNGACCPFENMRVINDKCVWCMDPALISTIVVDGCGKCRPGTFEHKGACYRRLPVPAANALRVSTPRSNGVFWSADLNITSDPQTLVSLYLTNRTNFSNPCVTLPCRMDGFISIFSQWAFDNGVVPLDSHSISSQYLQFDRGRLALNMTLPVIRSWASCPDNKACSGAIVAIFVTVFQGSASFRTQHIEQKLRFETGIQSLVLAGGGTPTLLLARMELHYFARSSAWRIRLVGVEEARWTSAYVQWDHHDPLAAVPLRDGFIDIEPPPQGWTAVRVRSELNSTTLLLQQPVSVVTHESLDAIQYSGILVQIRYGLAFHRDPLPGDSEQLVFITAKSPQPIRLSSLSSTIRNEPPSIYTTPKGFIRDSTRVLDLSIGCIQPSSVLVKWITNAIGILPDSPPGDVKAFAEQSCALIQSGAVSKAYWMVPIVPTLCKRTDLTAIQISAEFV